MIKKQKKNLYQYPNIKPLENIIDTILTITGINSNRNPKDKIGPEENNNYSPTLKLRQWKKSSKFKCAEKLF